MKAGKVRPEGQGRRIGYARVSTGEQDTGAQIAALKTAGCTLIFEDTASGGDRERPQLARAVEAVREGDTLVVARLDRLARSLSHLLELTEGLRARGGHFRSLADPFDTASPQGMLMMQMLGAFAEFERALIRERTKAGIAAAVARGAKPGNPKMRERDPTAIRLMKAALADTNLERTRAEARSWLQHVERFRPHLAWTDVARIINRERDRSEHIHVTTLKAQVRRLVKAGDLPESVLDRAKSPTREAAALAVRSIQAEHPEATLRGLAAELDKKGIHPPRGDRWSAETVRRLLQTSPA
jgi:DNA invertase Pin-like site-specific DNA recombinase